MPGMSERKYVALRVPASNTLAWVFAAVTALLLVAMIPLLAIPMKVPGGDCGTIFASSNTWKYDSHFDAATDLRARAQGSTSESDLDSALHGSVDAMMADLAMGRDVYAACKDEHQSRLIWIITVAVPLVLLGAASAFLVIRSKRNSRRVLKGSDPESP